MARFFSAIALAGVVVLGGACAGDDAPVAAVKPAVVVKGFAFTPKQITVKAGTAITWTNRDDFDHSVVIGALGVDGPKFGPQSMPTKYTHTLDTAGTYPYMCGVHNSMTGTVVVTS